MTESMHKLVTLSFIGHLRFYHRQKKKDFLIMDSLMFSIFSVVCWMVGWCLSRICVSYMIDKIVFLQNY